MITPQQGSDHLLPPNARPKALKMFTCATQEVNILTSPDNRGFRNISDCPTDT